MPYEKTMGETLGAVVTVTLAGMTIKSLNKKFRRTKKSYFMKNGKLKGILKKDLPWGGKENEWINKGYTCEGHKQK